MKIELLIAPYLLTYKTLSLQDIGTFHVTQDLVLPTEQDKELMLPENAIRFDYNPRAGQDDAFIKYIMEQTRKIKPLATSDLESFTMLGKQFMNIGKPLILEGLGMLFKNQSGQYEFKQGISYHNPVDTQSPQLKEKETAEISFSTPPRKQGNKNWLAAIIVLVIAVALGLLFYSLRSKKNEQAEKPVVLQQETLPSKPDTLATALEQKKVDSLASIPPKTDSFSFKVVIREYNNAAMAEKKQAQFKTYGYQLMQIKVDSTHYLLAMPFMNPLSDSTRIRDSLKILFGGKPYLRLQ